MLDLSPYAHCICQKMDNIEVLCAGEYIFAEQGKKVTLIPRQGEVVTAIALDGCVFSDRNKKCDGIFLLYGGNLKAAVLVELKSGHHIADGFEQLAFVQKQRPEYQEMVGRLQAAAPGPLKQKAFIITNGSMSKPERERLENHYGVRVQEVIHCEATTPIPNIRRMI